VVLCSVCSCGVQKPVDYEALQSRLRSVLQVHTCEYVYKDISYLAESEKFLWMIPTADRKLLYSVKVRVRAGLDVSKGLHVRPLGSNADRQQASGQQQSRGTKSIEVILPPPCVLLVDADEASIHQYFSEEYGGRMNVSVWQSELEKVKARIAADAVKRGILVKAEANAHTLIKALLGAAGFDDVRFVQSEDVPASSAPVPGVKP